MELKEKLNKKLLDLDELTDGLSWTHPVIISHSPYKKGERFSFPLFSYHQRINQMMCSLRELQEVERMQYFNRDC